MAAWSREAMAATAVASAAAAYLLLRDGGLTRLRTSCARAAVAFVQLGTPTAPRVALRVLQREPLLVRAWVALCGTVFDVTDDPYFDAHTGVYALWTGHDVTHLLVQMGTSLDGADDAAMANYRDRELPIALLNPHANDSARRMVLLREWYVRFHTRYDVAAQLSDLYTGHAWDALRAQLVPPAVRFGGASTTRVRGKCPMGFGARALDHVVSRADPTSAALRTVTFQGKRYDVTHSSLFQAPHGAFAHFVGHDITYALATQSSDASDLDVTPARAYTYAEQVLLERYRIAFATELALLVDDRTAAAAAAKADNNGSVDVHALLDACDTATTCDRIDDDDTLRILTQYFADPVHAMDVDCVCVRTAVTPLHKAVEKNRLDIVELLVRVGANVDAKAALYDFETPQQMAERFQFSAIVAFLATASEATGAALNDSR